MINIEKYMDDGANWQAQAVLAYLRYNIAFVINTVKGYKYDVYVGRWENCREQGYVFRLYVNHNCVKNYCVYEHRNSNYICVQMFTKDSINTPSIDDVFEGKKDKWDIDKEFSHGEILACGVFIADDMIDEYNNFVEKEESKKKNR